MGSIKSLFFFIQKSFGIPRKFLNDIIIWVVVLAMY